jgi:glucokinase
VSEIVAVDIGGTHARFALAEIEGSRLASLGREFVLKTGEYASLETAWEEFAGRIGRPLPRAAGIAFAGPVGGEVLQLTNNPWVVRPALIPERLEVDRFSLVNDFGAVAHAVAQLGEDQFHHVCGPDGALPEAGVISIVGPGTGLGVAQLLRRGSRYQVIETEGGHTDFAPLDTLEDRILVCLRQSYGRVSVERIAAGMGLANIHKALAMMEGLALEARDEKELWTAALEGRDNLATAALDRYLLSLGSIAGDIALAQGADAVVIAGGLGLRIADHLPRSGFRDRFVAKGRFERRMDAIPVKLITHPQPGLYGAAAAYAERFGP